MTKRVLMVATVPSMIGQFNMNNINILLKMGYQVDVAADFRDNSVWPSERIQSFRNLMSEMGIKCIQLDFSREPLRIERHVKSYKETLGLFQERQYSFVHTHTPIASAIVRLAAHKTGTKVIYTAHGFHFYDGAPLKNWLTFYPVEKFFSRYTDVLITINKEDYKRAKSKLHAKTTVYVPGVGVDTENFSPGESGRNRIRTELNLKDQDVMILSVGELNDNKNHSSVIRAIKGMNITYVIVGKGEKKGDLESLKNEYGVDVRLMGFRNDVADFYNAADLYVLPSIREGLNVSLMEAMASGLAVACGSIRGNTDLIENENCLFMPTNPGDIKRAIEYALINKERLKEKNRKKILEYSSGNVERQMKSIYSNFQNEQ